MATDKKHIQHCILYEFQKGRKVIEARDSICSILGNDVVSYDTCKCWDRRSENSSTSHLQTITWWRFDIHIVTTPYAWMRYSTSYSIS